MVNVKTIMVRVTKNQHERIRNAATARGFKSVSEYIRSITLGNSLVFEEKFNELYDKFVNNNFNVEIKERPLKTFF